MRIAAKIVAKNTIECKAIAWTIAWISAILMRMNLFRSMWSRVFSFSRPALIDRYHLRVVTSPVELALAAELPIELRYVLAARPSRQETFRILLERGFGIGVRTVQHTPARVLAAVDRISRETQENTIIPWLENLLRTGELPSFSVEELERAEQKGINLYENANTILAERFEFQKIVLVDLHNRCIGEVEQQLMRDVNADVYPLAVDSIIHRVTFDNAHTRTVVAQAIIKALIVIGPIAHALEHVISGLGKVFAASADDVLSEVAELFALRGSGFTWRQLARRGRILIPVFALATVGAFQVEPLIHAGRVALAGAVFGLSAVALSLTTAIQSIGMYRQAYVRLIADGKLRLEPGQSVTKIAFRQDFTNPARLGLFVGALASPIVAAIFFSTFSQLVSNGWILALLGSTEAVVAGITVLSAPRIERALFRRTVRRAMGCIVGGRR